MYVKRVEIAGDIRTERRYHTARYGKKGYRRAPHSKPSIQQVQEHNERRLIHRLWLLLNANYVPGDYFLTLTYQKEQRPADAKTCKQHIQQFLRKCRSVYNRAGKTFRYIWVCEGMRKAPHIHIVCPYHDLQALQELWPYGIIRPSLLYAEGDFHGLAEYIVKETCKTYNQPGAVSRKRYNTSKNLIQPQIDVEVMAGNSWTSTPRVPKGYQLIGDVQTGESLFDGRPYQYVEYRRIAGQNPPQPIIRRRC